MEHDYIKDKEIVEKYILHQLSNEEDSLFEEHLLFCEECQSILEKRKSTIGQIKNSVIEAKEENPAFVVTTNRKKSNYRGLFIKMAASVLIILSIALINNLLLNGNRAGKKISDMVNFNDSLAIKRQNTSAEQITVNDVKNDLTEKYKTLPEFENFIKNTVRAQNLTVNSPRIDEKFKENEIIKFNWESEEIDSISLVIFDNKAKIISEKKIAQTYDSKQKLNPGLYYWQLESPEEALFTGKFIVKIK